MPIVHIDFETRSTVNIKECGAGRYASDPSTRILCVCWALDNGPIYGQFGEAIPVIFKEAISKGWVFSAFNAMFEQLIWHYRWPGLKVPQFRCTRALVASHGLPQSLDRACKSLHVGWSKDPEGQRLIRTYSIPRKDGLFNEITQEDRPKMLRYCAKDVALSRRIMQRLPPLSVYEQKLYDWTVTANIRGVYIDTSLADKAEHIASILLDRGNRELGRLTDQRIFSVNQIQRIKNYLRDEYGIEVDSLDKEAIEELLLLELPDKVKRLLEIRRDLSQSSVRKFKRAKESVCADGRIKDTMIYHGAATGRWSSQVVQFQNLPKYTVPDPQTAMKLIDYGDPDLFETCYKSPMLTLSGCIRGVVIPQPGKKLAVVDYSAIEARILMWAARQSDAVVAFHKGLNQYIGMAELIYDKKGLTKTKNPKEYFLGKTTFLGCGYQMGHIKFQATCESYGIDLGEKTEYLEKDDGTRIYYSPLARRAVEMYRTRFPYVTYFWRNIQQAAELCIKTGRPYRLDNFRFHREREFLYLTLPSGRRLAYHKPGCDEKGLFYYGEDSQTIQYVKKRLYGGKITENAIQGLARDILAHGILRLESFGYGVNLTVHDENVCEIVEDKSLDDIIKIMCDIPEWARGCPIAAEGFIAERYRKG